MKKKLCYKDNPFRFTTKTYHKNTKPISLEKTHPTLLEKAASWLFGAFFN